MKVRAGGVEKDFLVGMTVNTMMVSEQSLFLDSHKTAHPRIESEMGEGRMGNYLSLLNCWLLLVSHGETAVIFRCVPTSEGTPGST